MAENMFLYWQSGSGPCWKVRIALHEKGIHSYGQKIISIPKMEHKSEEIMKLNSRGQVPVFRDGNIVINESMAVMNYLERKYKKNGTQLIPDDNVEKMARVLQLTEEINIHYVQTFANGLFYYIKTAKEEGREPDGLKARFDKARIELDIWEAFAEKAKPFLLGGEFTMADVVMIVSLCQIVRFGCTLKKYPNLRRYYDELKSRPSVQETWPPHYRETENLTIFCALDEY